MRVVLVTGSSRGIGSCVARAFAEEKCRVVVHYRKEKSSAEAVAAGIRQSGGDVMTVQGDISRSEEADAIVRRVVDAWGRLDVLVNNAALTRDRTILKMTDDEWNDVIQTNLSGTFWCLRAAARVMVKQKDGCIINLSSIVGVRGSFGGSNYSSSKAGVMGLTRSAARELGRFQVRVHAVLPGLHLTEMSRAAGEEYIESARREHVLGKLTDTAELARFIVFLSQQKTISGQIYNFDSRIF
ncbi:MAG TPA: SDR family NAD(P)-dependent oxidoreductase [Elusimicrobiota bacterium]|nr:SDR family NAD(P)-dependent oxidoreductase [Elusimicrobiota bacterium]